MKNMQPKISFVVTSRNDDHGGGLMRRMQIFVNGLLAQCDRHKLKAELIVVEWNPPADRPPLYEVLAWPGKSDYCAVRFIVGLKNKEVQSISRLCNRLYKEG